MLKTLIFYLILEKRNTFINKYILPIRILSSLFNMVFYFYAAKAFVPSKEAFLSNTQVNLFEFVMVGEITLSLVSDSLLIFNDHMRKIINFNILDPLLNTKASLFSILFHSGISSLFLSLALLLIEITFLYSFFDLSFPFTHFLGAILINLMFLPLFIFLGIFNASLFMIFKRGTSLIGSLVTLLGVVSGVYFPINVFPEFLGKLIKNLNPLQFLVSETRLILTQGLQSSPYLKYMIYLTILNFILFFTAKAFLSYAVEFHKKRGSKIWLTS